MNVLRDVLNSGWTVAGATVLWLALFAVGIALRLRERRSTHDRRQQRLWEDRP